MTDSTIQNTFSKAAIKKWAEALRSGDYIQGSLSLQDGMGYCCLGVACDLFIPQNQIFRECNLIYGLYPKDQPHAPSWLKSVDQWFYEQTGLALSTLNDGRGDEEGFSFDEIADCLELVFIHEMLA